MLTPSRISVPAFIKLSLALTSISASLSALAAPPQEGGDAGLQEVVVSATRQGEQSIQTVPMSISVISPTNLDAKGLGGVSDFVRTLPSVNMQSDSPGVNSIEMRGLVTSFPDITIVQDRSLTATYLDDAPISVQAANPDLKVFDLERVEVLKGPQGTLFGAGSMSGTVRLITRKPDSHTFQFSGDTSVSETEHGGTNYSIRGSANLPIIEGQLAVRLGAYRGEDSGFIDNLELNKKDANDSESTQGRIAVRWTPTESTTLDASMTYAKLQSHGDYTTYPALGKYTYESLTPERFDDLFRLYNITAEQDLGFARLIASVSYQDRAYEDQRSFEFFDEALMTPGVQLASNAQQINTLQDAPQEIRLVSRQDQKLRWIVGAFHEYYHRFYPQYLDSPGFDSTIEDLYGVPPTSQSTYGTAAPDQPFWGIINVRERQYALFGELSYTILPKLDVTVGARYFDFRQEFNLEFAGFAGGIGPGEPLTRNGVQASKGANPRAVVSYKVADNLMVYSQAARGFRYGGVNLPVPLAFCASDLANAGLTDAPATFGPDNLWNYEVGEKGKFLDNKLLLNVTGFFIDWRDVQTTFPLQCGYPFIENKGRIHSQGAELETQFRVTPQLSIAFSGSFTDAHADGPLTNLGAPDGARVPYFPRLIGTFGADYISNLPVGKLRWSADYTYRGSAYTQFNIADPLTRYIPSSGMLNASVNYVWDNWEVGIYGTNLTDNLLISRVAPDNRTVPYQPDDQVFIGRPRTVGIRVHYGF
jgi:iron complex outermembrane receptor protein